MHTHIGKQAVSLCRRRRRPLVLAVDALDVSIRQSLSLSLHTCSCIVCVRMPKQTNTYDRFDGWKKKKRKQLETRTSCLCVFFSLFFSIHHCLTDCLPRSHFSLGRCSLFIHSASLCISSVRARNEHSHSNHSSLRHLHIQLTRTNIDVEDEHRFEPFPFASLDSVHLSNIEEQCLVVLLVHRRKLAKIQTRRKDHYRRFSFSHKMNGLTSRRRAPPRRLATLQKK